MSRWTLALTLFALPGLAACSTTNAESYWSKTYDINKLRAIAIVDGNNPTFNVTTRQALVDTFQMEFFKRGWNVIERSNIEKAMDEMDFQNKDITAEADRKQLGSVLNVQALVVINVAKTGEDLALTAKMMDVATGELIWSGSGEGSVNKGMSTWGGALAGAAVGAVVGHNTGSGAAGTGAVIGGVLGGTAGYAMTPSETENAKKVVAEVCESIPLR
ncbi:MAG TPA: hypothetical protein VFD43_13540 [Planctomycetota bacterium]|nr:hypothetical protein [Planctomycetota bacterium]